MNANILKNTFTHGYEERENYCIGLVTKKNLKIKIGFFFSESLYDNNNIIICFRSNIFGECKVAYSYAEIVGLTIWVMGMRLVSGFSRV